MRARFRGTAWSWESTWAATSAMACVQRVRTVRRPFSDRLWNMRRSSWRCSTLRSSSLGIVPCKVCCFRVPTNLHQTEGKISEVLPFLSAWDAPFSWRHLINTWNIKTLTKNIYIVLFFCLRVLLDPFRLARENTCWNVYAVLLALLNFYTRSGLIGELPKEVLHSYDVNTMSKIKRKPDELCKESLNDEQCDEAHLSQTFMHSATSGSPWRLALCCQMSSSLESTDSDCGWMYMGQGPSENGATPSCCSSVF